MHRLSDFDVSQYVGHRQILEMHFHTSVYCAKRFNLFITLEKQHSSIDVHGQEML